MSSGCSNEAHFWEMKQQYNYKPKKNHPCSREIYYTLFTKIRNYGTHYAIVKLKLIKAIKSNLHQFDGKKRLIENLSKLRQKAMHEHTRFSVLTNSVPLFTNLSKKTAFEDQRALDLVAHPSTTIPLIYRGKY